MVVGFARQEVLAFSVDWGRPEWGMTAWVGERVIRDGREQLVTLWHLVTRPSTATEPEWLWSAFRAGGDTFVR